ncbi:kelch repeat protein [Onchocerca flexuosa]|uniref:Kelch repeat protein n=1 Tax=Onchocerca flexuosa TaxID=387005 RepID=A0A238BWL4_9BILA|nr:kelch repeat protein [Onchocerca flexuosa]
MQPVLRPNLIIKWKDFGGIRLLSATIASVTVEIKLNYSIASTHNNEIIGWRIKLRNMNETTEIKSDRKLRHQRNRNNMEDSMDFIPSGINNAYVRHLPSSVYCSGEIICQVLTRCNHLTVLFDLFSDSPVASNYLLAQRLVSSQSVATPPLVNSGSNILESTEFHDGLHANVVLANMSHFRDEKFMCDIEIEVEGNIFSAHRYVLAAAIPYFHSMFASEMIESRQSRIAIQDIPAIAFQQLLDFAYTSRVHINGDNVQQLLYAASILQMDTVCGACQRFLTQYLTTANCLSIRQFAEQHNCVSLMSSVDDFAMEHFPELRVLPDFMRIPFGHLIDLLRNSDLKVNNEQEVFETVIFWVEENIEERRNCLPELLALVRLPQLPTAYFLNKVKKHPLIMECVRCRDLVADAMSEMMRAQIGPGISNMESASFSPIFPAVNCGTGGLHSGSTTNFQGVIPDISATKHTYTPIPSFGVWANCRPRKSAAGVIFCVGGRGTSGDPFRSVEAYDWRRDRWFAISDMNIRRRHVGVVSAQGKLYAIGGHDGTNHLSSAECFDPATNMWHTVASMDTRRRGIAVGALEGAIYAVGGLDDTACFQFTTVERYDIESDKWSSVEQMNVQRGGVGVAAVAGAGVTVLDGCLYAIGGFDDNAPLPSCERYNPEDNTWTLLTQMSCPRGGVGVASMGGQIYAIGGHDGVRYLNSVEAYDPVTNQWSSVATISQCRAGAGVAWADCRVDTLLRPPSMALGKDSGCAPCVTGVAHCV